VTNGTVAPPGNVIDRLTAAADQMPVLPQIAVRIMEEMRSPSTTAARLAELTKKDPILASTVLRVANSALYGGRTQISDLAYAIARIGLNQSRNLLLATVLRSKMANPKIYGARGAHMMDHALAVAFGSSLVASATGQDANEAFLCGLLHDFGRFALIKVLHDDGRGGTELSPEDQAWVDRFHPEAGAFLAEAWGLPEVVCETTRCHHYPEHAPEGFQQPAAVIGVADAVAHRLGLGADPLPDLELLDTEAARLAGVDEAILDDVMETLPGLFQTARSALFG
jgi:HD-like signal output (HDOD) protein